MNIGFVLALKVLSTIISDKSVPAFSNRGEVINISALYLIYFSFLFIIENYIL